MSNGLVQILDGNTFVVSDSNGDIEASLTDPTGLFSFDTRFLSKWVLTIDGQRLNALSVDDLQYFETRFFLVPGSGTVYVDAKLSVIRQRAVGNGFHEELTILNHDEKPVDLAVRIEAGSDFADLFEVKDALAKKGRYSARVERGRLLLGYERETFRRETAISATAPARLDKSGLTFRARIGPQGGWSTDLDVVTGEGGQAPLRPQGRRRARTRWLITIIKGDVAVSRSNAKADGIVRLDRTLYDGIASGEANAMAALLLTRSALKAIAGWFLRSSVCFQDYPESEELAGLLDETRVVVSELLGDLPGAWNEAPESHVGIVQPGSDELRPFTPRRP